MATIVSPSGREYQWTKDTPPTEADIAYIKQKDAELNSAQSTEQQAQPVAAEQPAQVKPTGLHDPMASLSSEVSKLKSSASETSTDVSRAIEWISKAIPKTKEDFAKSALGLVTVKPSDVYDLASKAAKGAIPPAVRVSPQVALGLMTRQPTTIGGAVRQAGMMYPVNLLTETLAQYAEWGLDTGPQPSKESIRAGAGRAITASAPMFGGPKLSALSQVTGLTAGKLVETGNLPTKSELTVSGALGFTGGLFDSFGRKTGRNVANLEETSREFGELGISMGDIPGHYLVPESGAASYRRTAVSGSSSAKAEAVLAAKMLNAAQRNIENANQVRAGGDIAADLGKNLQELNKAELAAVASSSEAAAAQAAVNKAQRALDQANESADDLIKGQASLSLNKAREELNLVLAKDIQEAVALFNAGVTKRGMKANPTNMKLYWEENIASKLEAYKESQASLKYSQQSLGFNPGDPLIKRSDVIDAISEAKSRLDASGLDLPQINIGDNEMLSLSDIRNIRKQISGGASFDAPPAQKRVYSAIGDNIAKKTRAAVQSKYGDESLSNLDSANQWYRQIYEATDNPLGRSLFGRVVNDDAVSRLAGNMVNGKSDEYVAAKKYIDAIAGGNTQLQSAMTKRLNSLVREKLISESSNEVSAGLYQIDANSLLSKLQTVSKTGGFDVSDLGFGNSSQLKEIRDQLSRFGGMTRLSSSELSNIFSDPRIEEALRIGGGLSVPVREKVAEMAARRRLYSSAISSATGKSAQAAKELSEANRLFSIANQSSTASANSLAQLNQSPLIRALSAGRDKGGKSFGLIGSQGEDFDSFVGYMMNSSVGKTGDKIALMSALEKENPLLRQEISHRYLMNLFDSLSRNTRAGVDTARKLDYDAMDKMFRPLFSGDKGAESTMMRVLLGDDVYKNLSKMSAPVKRLASAERALKGSTGFEDIAAPVGIGSMVGTGRLTGTFSQRNAIKMIVETYNDVGQHIMSFFYRNPNAFEAYRKTGEMATALGSIGTQALAKEFTINPELRGEAAKLDERNKAQKSPQ